DGPRLVVGGRVHRLPAVLQVDDAAGDDEDLPGDALGEVRGQPGDEGGGVLGRPRVEALVGTRVDVAHEELGHACPGARSDGVRAHAETFEFAGEDDRHGRDPGLGGAVVE